MNRMVDGVGLNDAGYPVTAEETIDGRRKRLWTCPFYRAWRSMLTRCYSAKCHEKFPTYIGCSVAPEWLKFSVFREWMLAQKWDDGHLDKDLLAPGNKVYGPDTCVFVSSQINTFMSDCGAARGQWPIGVHWNKSNGKFLAKCRNPFSGKEDHLGYYTCPASAHEAWRKRKYELACQYADQQTDPRIASALRTRYLRSEAYHEQ